MKTPYTILLLALLVCVTGCEDKKPDASPMLVENTTEIFTEADKKIQAEKKSDTVQNTALQVETTTEVTPVAQKQPRTNTASYAFNISNAQNVMHKLMLAYKKLTFHDIQTSTIVLNVFSSSCASCPSQIISLSKLQKKYGKKLFIASLSATDTQNDEVSTLIQEKKIKYFVSQDKKNDTLISELFSSLDLNKNISLPLTVIYKDGNYYSHFEGAIPIEMIDHDIQQTIQK